MKPKTKFQKQVVEASNTLPAISAMQIQWGYDNAIDYIGRRTEKDVMTCTKCGYSWDKMGYLVSILTECYCPNCKTKLKVETTKKRTFGGGFYMTVITAHRGFQVIRTVMLKYATKIGCPAEYTHLEVMQRWLAPNGKYCTLARLRHTHGAYCYDLWLPYSPLELRRDTDNNQFCMNVYDLIYVGAVYPRQKLIHELKRTGYKRNMYGRKPLELFRLLLTDSRAETLLKTGYAKVLKYFMSNTWSRIENYWPSIRICIRNGYKIDDVAMWRDYIDFLRFFGRDLHNAKYVCPVDLRAEHDRYMVKKAKADARADLEEQLKKENEFREAKGKFFGLAFSDGRISVRVLESIRELIEEGDILHHCVGSYHSRKSSLILSASVDGKRIETVEISLSELKVIQCRGNCNQNTPYHAQIIDLVNQNMKLIQERLTA